ncbi:MAG: hypothetical protein PHP54_03640 [Clostridia bacterium]|nr:hypothetical protein [Clostridia bacterium]
MSKGSIYHYLIKQELRKSNPIKYHELIINGAIDSYLDYKEIEIKDMLELVEKQLRKNYLPPNDNNYFDDVRYENMIRCKAIEITHGQIIL